MTKTNFAVVAILLALTMPASAQNTSANEYLPGCKSWLDKKYVIPADEALMQGLCAGFVYGFGQAMAAGEHICPPKGVTTGQSVAVVVKYIEARPERMHESFGKLVLEALMAAWPCKR